MEQKENTFSLSVYDKYIQDDENLQAKIKPIMNQIQEQRVTVKELHIEFGTRFSEIINSYQNRLEEMNGSYETMLSDLIDRRNAILKTTSELLEKVNCESPELLNPRSEDGNENLV